MKNRRPLGVYRMRGAGVTVVAGIPEFSPTRYGGWKPYCRRCGWTEWANDQSDGFDRAMRHCCGSDWPKV